MCWLRTRPATGRRPDHDVQSQDPTSARHINGRPRPRRGSSQAISGPGNPSCPVTPAGGGRCSWRPTTTPTPGGTCPGTPVLPAPGRVHRLHGRHRSPGACPRRRTSSTGVGSPRSPGPGRRAEGERDLGGRGQQRHDPHHPMLNEHESNPASFAHVRRPLRGFEQPQITDTRRWVGGRVACQRQALISAAG